MIENAPVFYDFPIANKEDGRLTSDAFLFFDQVFQTLDVMLNAINAIAATTITQSTTTSTFQYNGLQAPNFTALQIDAFALTANLGTIWYNTDTNQLNYLDNLGVQIIQKV